MSESQWRQRSAIVIASVLATLPPTATLKEKRNAIRAAYPFGLRRFHPYKMWLKEVAVSLKPDIARGESVPPKVEASRCGILCGWCTGYGCLACLAARVEHEAIKDRQAWLGFWSQIDAGNTAARTALADWLKDQDLEELAKLI